MLLRRKPEKRSRHRGRKYITFEEIVSGKERIVPLEQLGAQDLKRLVIARQRLGPDYTVQAISGAPMSRDMVIDAIERDLPFGRVTVEADLSHLRDLLAQIQEAL